MLLCFPVTCFALLSCYCPPRPLHSLPTRRSSDLMEDFDAFVARARELDLEVAMDIALQCSPDHPWVTEHPEWFDIRPDGSIAYAENPPKKYQDIYPLSFETDYEGLYVAIREDRKSV